MVNNSKPIVHIATDEKFINAAYDIYERAFPNNNTFLILRNSEQTEIKHLSKEKDYNFIDTEIEYISLIEKISHNSQLIIFHGLSYKHAQIALKIKKGRKKYLWTVFGTEVYDNKSIIKNGIIGKITHKKFVFNVNEIVKSILRPLYHKIGKGKGELIKRSMLTMDYIGILYREEYDFYQKLEIVKNDVEHIKYTYYPLDTIIIRDSGFIHSSNILLGNSASYTNNHLEAIEILKKLDLKNNNIVTPLSYGNKEYANQIEEIGKQEIGKRFMPLTEFLPLNEYQKILQSCGIVIMNHYRQQAVGNVLNALYLGAKVYLSNNNTLYHYLRRIGCHVFCIEEDLVPENRTVFDLLSKDIMIENRDILKEELSFERVVNELKQKLSPVLN